MSNFLGRFLVLFCMVLVTAASNSRAATVTTAGNGDWNSTTPNAPWPGGTPPGPSDSVVIQLTHAITVTANATINSITFNNDAGHKTLTVKAGATLGVTGAVLMRNSATDSRTAAIQGTGAITCATLTVGGSTTPSSGKTTTTMTCSIGSLTISGNLSLLGQDPGTPDNDAILNLSSGTINIGGTVALNAASSGTATLSMATGAQSGTLVLSGATPFSGSGTFTANGTGSTVQYSGVAQTIRAVAYRHLTLSGSGTKTLNSVGTINGNLTLSGTAVATTAAAMTIGGDLVVGSGASLTVAGFNTAVSGTTTVSGTLAHNNSSGTKSFKGDVTINAGGRWIETVDESFGFGGSLVNNGTFTARASTHTFTGTPKLLGGANGLIIPNITIASGSYQLTGNVVSSGKFEVASGANLNCGEFVVSGGGFTLNGGSTLGIGHANGISISGASGNIQSTGTRTFSTGASYTYDGTVGQITGSGLPATVANLSINNNATVSLSGSVTIGGTLTLAGGPLAVGANTVTLNGPAIAGTPANLATTAASSLGFGGSAVGANVPSNVTTLNNLTINNANGVTLNSSLTLNGTLTFTSGRLTTGANILTLAASPGGTVSGATTGRYVAGKVQKLFNASAGQSFTFPIGDASAYTPVALATMSVTAPGSVTASTTSGEHPVFATSALDASRNVNRYWTLNGSGIGVSAYSATFNFLAGDVDAGAAPGNFAVRKYDGSWSATTIGTRTATSATATGVNGFGDFAVGQQAVHRYAVAAASPQSVGVPFNVTITARDIFDQPAASSHTVTMSGTGSVQFDSNNNGVFDDNVKALVNGVFTISTKDDVLETVTITATDANGKTGSAGVTLNSSLGEYRSVASGNWNSATTWEMYDGTTWSAATNAPTAASAGFISIQSGHIVTNTLNVTLDHVNVQANGQLVILSGVTLTLNNGVGTDLNVRGKVTSAGTITINSGATIAFQSGATYEHGRNGGTIPTASWNTNSTCWISGTTSTLPVGLGQSFGHFTWNCATQIANLSLGGTLGSIAGNFVMASTGIGQLQQKSSSSDQTLLVGGNYSQSGGTYIIKAGGDSSTDIRLSVGGNFTLTGGTLNLNSDSDGSGTLAVAGDFSVSGIGTLRKTGGVGALTFNGSVAQNFANSGIILGAINVAVNNGATLLMGNHLLPITVTGTFVLNTGGTLGIGHANGITTSGASGNIQSTGTRTFSTGANYIYHGTAAQITGSGLPATVANLSIDNNAGVSLSGSATISGTLTLVSGPLAVGANTLTLNGPAIAGTPANLATTSASSLSFGGSAVGVNVPSSVIALNNLTINNANGVTLNSSPALNGALTLTNGRLATGANTLTLAANPGGTVSGATSARYVAGKLQKLFNAAAGQSFTFPIGNASAYTPVALATMNVTAPGGVTASTTSGEHPAIANSGIDASKDVNRYWTLNGSGIGVSAYNATFNFLAGDVDAGAATANFAVKKYNGSWSSTTVGTRTATSIQATSLTSFSDFAVGEATVVPPPPPLSQSVTQSFTLNYEGLGIAQGTAIPDPYPGISAATVSHLGFDNQPVAFEDVYFWSGASSGNRYGDLVNVARGPSGTPASSPAWGVISFTPADPHATIRLNSFDIASFDDNDQDEVVQFYVISASSFWSSFGNIIAGDQNNTHTTINFGGVPRISGPGEELRVWFEARNGRVAVDNVKFDVITPAKLQHDFYTVTQGETLSVPAPGVLGNDTDGTQATVATGPERGTLNLNVNGGFSYASTGADGMDGYIYQAKDAANHSIAAVALISVLPPGALFKDDFERPADLDLLMPWQMREGSASISAGLMKASAAESAHAYAYFNADWTDYSVEGRARFPAGSFGFTEHRTWNVAGRLNATGGRYEFGLLYEGAGHWVLRMVKYSGWGGGWSSVASDVEVPDPGTTSHTLKLTFQGNRILAYYDDVLRMDATDDFAPYTSGGIVLGMYREITPFELSFEEVIVTQPADATLPTLTSVMAVNSTTVQVLFSESVTTTSAQTTGNYSINNGVTISGAVLDADTRTVTLTTSTMAAGNYTLTVNNVSDGATPANSIAPNSQTAFNFTPPDTTPPTVTSVMAVNATTVQVLFSEPVTTASAQTVDNYSINNGVTISEAVLGADTLTVTLTTSTLGGGEYTLTVNNVADRATSANTLTPNSPTAFTFTPPDTTSPTVTSVTAVNATTVQVSFSEPVTTASAQTVDNYSINNGVTISEAVLGADTRTVTLTTSSLAGGGYMLTVNNVSDGATPANTIAPNSQGAFSFAPPDTTSPTVTSVTAVNATTVQVSFSEPVTTASAQTVDNYSINNGVTISGAVLGADTRTVTLTTSTLAGGNYTVTVNNVMDRATPGNTIAANSQAAFSFASTSTTPADWWNAQWRYRVPVEVNVESFARENKPVNVILNFTQLLGTVGGGTMNDVSLRVIEVSASGTVLDAAVPFQFDRDAAYDAATNARGNLIFLLSGNTPANATRYFHVYFDTASGFSPAPVAAQVTITDNVSHEEQSSFQIATTTGTYYYHKEGAGFASLDDVNGNDWIGYHPGGGSAGEYRGIPNMGEVGHPGDLTSSSTIVNQGPLKATIQSQSLDGNWRFMWEFYPNYATMTLQQAGGNYWLLYEGTPGGTFEPDLDSWTRSSGETLLCSQDWVGDVTGPEWVYFRDGTLDRYLFLAHHEDDALQDQYWQLQGNMTVFGFGRQYQCCGSYLTAVPARLTIGLGDGTATAPEAINSAFRELDVLTGAVAMLQEGTPPLPAPWQTVDIGSPAAAGSVAHSSGAYTVQGAGNISGSVDNFHYVYQTLSADGEIIARVFLEQDTGVSARAGVMIRESLNNNATHAMLNVAPDGTFRFEHRTTTGDSTSSTASTSGEFPNTWVRLVRSGDTFTAYSSPDGATWTQVDSASITMASNIYIGVAVTSGSSTLNTSIFDSITVVP